MTVNATSSMSILVSWKEPFVPNGVISEYWIYFGQQKHDLNQTAVARSARSRELSALRPFTTYYIKVRAKTTELGDASVLLNATTFEDSKFLRNKGGKCLRKNIWCLMCVNHKVFQTFLFNFS